MPQAPQKAPRKRFPAIVKRGSVQVKVYRAKHKRTAKGIIYVVAWRVGGIRRLKQFTDLGRAEAEAILKAEQLAAGRVGAADSVSMEDAEALQQARALAGDVPFLSALAEWRKARDITGGQLLQAAHSWQQLNGAEGCKPIAVPEIVTEFMAAKQRAGVDTTASYRAFLPRLHEKFSGPMKDVTARALTSWLHETFAQDGAKLANPVTFNTGRKRLVALWRWARKEGYLPAVAQTQAERIDAAREPHVEIGIIDVNTFARVLVLMRDKHPDYLAATVIAGFCGLRRAELWNPKLGKLDEDDEQRVKLAQRWDDVNLERGFVRVTCAKRNTPAKRLVPLSGAAVEWLLMCKRDGDFVSPAWGLDRVRAFAREAKINLPENGFRHSFISHRVAATGNVAETALEAGNSPQIIHQHYRELVCKEDGGTWHALSPAVATALVEGKPLPISGLKKKAAK